MGGDVCIGGAGVFRHGVVVEIGGLFRTVIYIRATGDDLCYMYIRNDMMIGETNRSRYSMWFFQRASISPLSLLKD